MTFLGWLLGTNTTDPAEHIDEIALAKLGFIGLLFYGGYRLVKRATRDRHEEDE